MNKKLLIFPIFLFLSACSGVEFAYKKNEVQKQLLNNTNVVISGDSIPFVNSAVISKFGSPVNEKFNLEIYISETKTNMTIKKNQVSSRVDYDIEFEYRLKNINKKCLVFINNQYSRFSFTPKSEGYNFGSDKSLEILYKRNTEDNIDKFLDSIIDEYLDSFNRDRNLENRECLDED